MTAEALEVRERLFEAFDRVDLHRPSLALGVLELAAGTKKTVAPARRTATAFWATPPTSPTVPSSSMVPVAATERPPVRSPPERISRMPSVKARPADGPPTSPTSMLMSNGKV